MNTETKRPLKMLDVDAADAIQLAIVVGNQIEYLCDGITRTDIIVDKTAFSVTVKQETCKLTIPIEYTTVYQLEKAKLDMARPRADGTTAARGRPARQSQAPTQHPSETQQQPPQQLPGHDAAGNLMLPPGSPGMPTSGFQTPPMMITAEAAISDQIAALVAPREVTIPQVQSDPDWVEKAIDDMAGTLIDSLRNVVENAVMDALEKAPQTKKTATCFVCVHIDITSTEQFPKGRCAKFNELPPLFVIAAPEGKCTEFVDGSAEIPM